MPACLRLRARAGGDAGARPRRWCGCKRGRGERAEAAAAGHGRPWQAANLPVALENSRKKSSSLCSPGLRCQRCLGPCQPAQPSPGRQHRRQTAAGGGPGGLKPWGASPAAWYVPTCTLTSSNNWRCWSPALLNTPQTAEQHARGMGKGYGEGVRMPWGWYPAAAQPAAAGGGAGRVLGREIRWWERPGPPAAFLQTHSDPPSASVSPGAASAHPLRGVELKLTCFLGVTPPAPSTAFLKVGKLRHSTHQARLEERQDATALPGSRENPASSRGGAWRGPGPWPRIHPPTPGSIPWPAAPGPRGFPAETPLGLQGREMFYGTGKKKSFANRPRRCQLLRPALRQRRDLGVARSPQPCSRHTVGTAAMGVAGLE